MKAPLHCAIGVSILACATLACPTVSAAPPVLAYAHFRDTDAQHLRVSYSLDDGTTWTDTDADGVYADPLGAVRDPSVKIENGVFYFIATPASGTQVQLIQSTDLKSFTLTTVDISQYLPGATGAWAPEFCTDEDGQDYFFLAVSTAVNVDDSTSAMLPYLFPVNLQAGTAGVPTAVHIQGTTQQRTFDFFPFDATAQWSVGTAGSKHYLWYVDQQPGGATSLVTQPIAYAVSDTLAGPYTQVTQPGADYLGLATFQTEAPTLFPLSNGCVRVLTDEWVASNDPSIWGGRAYSPWFRDSCPTNGLLFSQTSFIAPPAPLNVFSEHGTVVSITDSGIAAVVTGLKATPGRGTIPGF